MNQALNLSIYIVSGKDATALLQGQLTQDMATTDKKWKYAAHCNPKGRVISLYQTFNLHDCHYLITPTELAEAAIAQLQKYVMRSQVVIKKSSLKVYFYNQSDSINSFEINNIESKKNLHHEDNGDIILSHQPYGFFRLCKKPLPQPSDQIAWDSARIQSGIPRIYAATIGQFTPEAINLDASDAVSFTKGCYTGQEIIARMHYLGKAKQRLYYLFTNSKEVLAPNSTINNLQGEKIGFIVDTDNKGNVLGSLKVDKADNPLFVGKTEFSINRII